MMKKIVSACMVICVILSCFTGLYANASNLTKSDVAEKAGLLQAIGIISNVADETEGAREITRAEFAVTVAKCMGIKEQKEEVRYFTDVPADHWSISYVNRLVEQNIISIPADKLFRPNEKISVNEAVKMLVCMCGYGDYAVNLGGYPMGFAEIARRLDFTVTRGTENLSVYDSYIMLYDALRSPIYTITGIRDSEYIRYAEGKETLLSMYFDIYETEGIITQSSGVSIYGDAEQGETLKETAEIVKVNNEKYTSDLKFDNFLGRKTNIFYFQENEDDVPHIIYRTDFKRTDEVIDIGIDDFKGYKNGEISYYTGNNKLKTVTIPAGAIIVKNGKIIKRNLEDSFKIKKGDIRIIDIEDDNIFDVVIISEYRNIVVDRITTDSFVLYDKIVLSENISLDDSKRIVSIEDVNGAVKSFSDIKVGDVISVYESEDYVRVIINSAGVSATLYATSMKNDKFKIQLGKSESDKAWYEVDKDYYNEYLLGKYYTTSEGKTVYTGDIDLTPGGTVTYYKDVAGKIAYLTGPTPSGWTIGYLVGVAQNQDMFNDKPMLKIFTQNGEMIIFNTANSVKVDGVSKKGYDNIRAALDKTLSGKTLEKNEHNINGQVIRFKTNAEGVITAIDTEYVNTEAEERLSLHRTQEVKTLTWWYHTGSFYTGGIPQLFYTGNTIKFGVPSHAELPTARDDDFSIMTTYTDTSTHKMEGFKLDVKSANEDVLVEYGASEQSIAKGPFLVNEVYEVATEDGVTMQAEVYNVESCSTIEITAKDGYEFTYQAGTDKDGNPILESMEKGDLILVNVDGKGLAVSIKMYYDYSRRNDDGYIVSTGWLKGSGTYQDDINTYLLAAYVKNFDSGFFRFKYGDKITEDDLTEENYSDYTWATKNDAKRVLVYDGRNITFGTEADIIPATITGAKDAPLYFFAIKVARVKGAVVYK